MTPIIYNIFPRLIGPLPDWVEHAARARRMHFNWLYINPWHYPGFSGSLYAPKELRRLNPLFLPEGADPYSLQPLSDFLGECRKLELPVMMDLVINHTSKDSPLIDEHPEWYVRDEKGEVVSPSVTDPDDPTNVTVWGDLAEIDNANSADRERLWDFWAELVRDSIELGFAGFRCDAAYMVPAELWAHLIQVAREVNPNAMFFAETLGAPESEVLALRDAGFDYFFNSSKWWDFKEPWALDQHESFGEIAPSVSFPETHDTTRVAGDTGADEAIQRQRYAFAAAFSAGLMMPLGYEYGFRNQVNVVTTTPSDWEDPSFDLSDFVRDVNELKLRHPHLQGEGRLRAPFGFGDPILVLERRVEGERDAAFILINTDTADEQTLELDGIGEASSLRAFRSGGANPTSGTPVGSEIRLDRAEIVYLLPGTAAKS